MKAKFTLFKTTLLIFLLAFAIILCPNAGKAYAAHELIIIGTADLQGHLEPSDMKLDLDGDGKKEKHSVGGISRLATLINKIKAEKQDAVVVVSTGDDLMNRYFHTFKGKAIYNLLSMAGYEIYAFGNHEFDKGPKVLSEALKNTKFQCICTDLKVKGTSLDGLCKPWLIRDFKGLKVGFFSLMTEDFPLVTSGKDVKLTGNNLDASRRAVQNLRNHGADIVVALTHIGYPEDQKIAKAVPGSDIIFGAHSHDYLPELVDINNTIIVNGGEKGAYLVRLDLIIDSNGKIDKDRVKYQLIPVTEDIIPDAEIDALLKNYNKSFPEAIVLGRTDVEWNMTSDALRKGESPVANLVNDLLRDKFHVDIVLNNAGALRGKKIYPPGPITDVMLKEIDEFSNYAYTLNIKGKYIKEILERSAANFGEGGLLQPSGLRYTIDLKKPAQKISKNNCGKWTIDAAGKRVTDIQVLDKNEKWVKLNPDKSYSMLSNGFIVKHGGDGYFWFKQYGKNLKNTYSTFYSILTEFVESKGVLNPGKPDNRLKIEK